VWKYLLLKIKSIFLRESYVCPRCIFIFDSDQAKINSVGKGSTWQGKERENEEAIIAVFAMNAWRSNSDDSKTAWSSLLSCSLDYSNRVHPFSTVNKKISTSRQRMVSPPTPQVPTVTDIL
jgi:hypothetical protein